MASSMREDEDNFTHPIKCSGLRKGGYVLLKGKPCKIVEMRTAQPGKHGHAKVHLIGLDLFTSKKIEDVFPSTHTVAVPEVDKQEVLVSNVSQDGYVTMLLESGELSAPIQITSVCEKSESQVLTMFEQAMETDSDELLAQVVSAMGQQVIKDMKLKRAK